MRFLEIPFNLIKEGQVFSMPLFLFEKQSKRRLVSLYPNIIIDSGKYAELTNKYEHGGIFQIIFEDLEDFCAEIKCDRVEIEAKNIFLFKIYTEMRRREDKYKELADSSFLLKTFFLNENDINLLLNKVKAEIMMFPLSMSDEVSLTTILVEQLFSRPSVPVLTACCAYSIAKVQKIKDPETLSSIVLAALFKDVGLNQIQRDLYLTKLLTDENYLKHPMISIYVLSKTNFEFSKLTKRLILEHHEVGDGSGFPRGKKEEHIDFLSIILRVADDLVKLTSGFYNSQKFSWSEAFKIIQKERPIEGMNNTYPHHIKELIGTLI